MREWDELGYSDEVMARVFFENAERILGLSRRAASRTALG